MVKVYQLHHHKNTTPTGDWTHLNSFKEKECLVCFTKFKPRSGVHKFCSDGCKGKWKYINGTMTTESQYQYISGNWDRYFARLCCRSRKRSELTIKELKEILISQDYKCALSGVELTCKLEKGIKFKTNASIDRIDAGGPYIKQNIQLVCSALNSWRSDTELNEFIWWCKKVTEFQNEKKECF